MLTQVEIELEANVVSEETPAIKFMESIFFPHAHVILMPEEQVEFIRVLETLDEINLTKLLLYSCKLSSVVEMEHFGFQVLNLPILLLVRLLKELLVE